MIKTYKKITVFLLSVCFALTLFCGILGAIPAAAEEFIDNSGKGTDFVLEGKGGARYNAEDNTEDVWVTSAEGNRAVYKTKVSLDDFQLEYSFDYILDNNMMGFGFDTQENGDWNKGGTTVLTIHNSNYTDPNCVQMILAITRNSDKLDRPFTKILWEDPSEFLIGNAYNPEIPAQVRFASKLETEGEHAGEYRISFHMASEGNIFVWPGDITKDVVFYLTVEDLFGKGNAAQDLTLFFAARHDSATRNVKISKFQDNKAIAAADAALAAYEKAEGAADEIFALRTEAITAINKVSVLSQKALTDRLAARDQNFKSNADIEAAANEKLTAQVNEYAEAVKVLDDEANITPEAFRVVSLAYAKIDFTMFSLLTDEHAKPLQETVAASDIKLEKAEIISALIGFEQRVDILKEKKNLDAYFDSVKYRGLLEEKMDKLSEADKAAIEKRLAAGDAVVAEYKELLKEDLTNYYLEQYEAVVQSVNPETVDPATITPELLMQVISAKQAVVFDNTFTRFEEFTNRVAAGDAILNAGATKVYQARMAEMTAGIADAKLKEDLAFITKIEGILPTVDLKPIEQLACYEQLKAEYDAIAKTIADFHASKKFENFKSVEMVSVVKTDKGITIADDGDAPARLNYNKPVSMKDIKLAVSIDQYSYVGTGNNLFFCFYPQADQYRGGDEEGFIIQIQTNRSSSDVFIYRSKKNTEPLAIGEILTIKQGANFIIRVQLTEGKWLIMVNEAQMEVSTESVGINKDLFKQGDDYVGYFSIGNTSDKKENLNIMTVKQVGENKFSSETFEFPEYVPQEVEEEKGGCGSVVAVQAVVLGAVATLGALSLVRKKKSSR